MLLSTVLRYEKDSPFHAEQRAFCLLESSLPPPTMLLMPVAMMICIPINRHDEDIVTRHEDFAPETASSLKPSRSFHGNERRSLRPGGAAQCCRPLKSSQIQGAPNANGQIHS